MLLLPAVASAEIELTYAWTAPTTGSPVEYYVCETRTEGAEWGECGGQAATEQLTVLVSDGVQGFQIRVAGVDAFGRQGPWSPASDPFSEAGAPGSPTLPILQGVEIVAP